MAKEGLRTCSKKLFSIAGIVPNHSGRVATASSRISYRAERDAQRGFIVRTRTRPHNGAEHELARRMDQALLYRLAVALAVGIIVGVERGWKTRDEHGGIRLAGIRTFALTGLFGGATAALAPSNPAIPLAAGLVALGALIVAGYLLNVRATQDFGLTTELALLATYVLGAGATLGYPFEAAAGAIVMAVVLGFKSEAHRLVESLERHELVATLQLLLIAAVLVPLLPARDLGPWEAVNPRTIGMLVLLIAGLSYVGYFAVRMLGSHLGLVLTALFGGLSSSTAVTVAYARRSRKLADHAWLFGAGIALAAATMVPRVTAAIAVLNAGLLADLWPTFLVLAAVPLVPLGHVLLGKRRTRAEADIKLTNPLELRTALIFGAALSVLFIAAAALQEYLGDAGIYAAAAIAGLVDVDAISLLLARGAGRTIEEATAERAIVIALLVNTASKAALAAALGGLPMVRTATVTLAVALVAAAVTAAVTLN
jgi:uncharacterized membrane protein (DUF4010 family)